MVIKQIKDVFSLILVLSILFLFVGCGGGGGDGSNSEDDAAKDEEPSDPCAGNPECFPVTITLSGAVSDTFVGMGSLKTDWISYTCDGFFYLHSGTLFSISSVKNANPSFSVRIMVKDYGYPPTEGTYSNLNACNSSGEITFNDRKWEWKPYGDTYQDYTLVLDTVSVKVINPQLSVYNAHGSLEASAVPLCTDPGGEIHACTGTGIGNVSVHATF